MQKDQAHQQTAKPAYPIASVDNALRLLMLLRKQTRVRLSEASEHLGVAHSTAHRLLAMLAYHGFVRQERDSRAYVAGPALVEIGLAAIRQMDIRLHARPVLEDLAARFAETAHLARARSSGAVPGRGRPARAYEAVLSGPDSPLAALVVSAPVTRLDTKSSDRIAARLRAEAHRLSDLTTPSSAL